MTHRALAVFSLAVLLALSCQLVVSFVSPAPRQFWHRASPDTALRAQDPSSSSSSCDVRAIGDRTKHAVVSGAAAAATAVMAAASVAARPAFAADDVAQKPKKAKKPKILETENGIKYIVMKPGSGPYPQPGDLVVITYSAFLSNGTMYDSNDVKGRKPLSFLLGQKQVIPGLEEVIEYMQPGAEVTCSIPAKYAYGDKGICLEGQGCLVPPGENINYAVKLKSAGAGYL
jgi:FKBP-type peptidyl-prolyl cis-trans isomerase